MYPYYYSAFFSRPIDVALVFSETALQHSPNSPTEPLSLPDAQALASVSPNRPITQTRQVHLQCNGKIACTATSIVRITSPEVAHLFLEEKYPIGQMFRRLRRPPAPELLDVGVGPVDLHLKDDNTETFERGFTTGDSNQLWRRYKLVIPDFDCEILEVFPSRKMFVDGEAWLNGEEPEVTTADSNTINVNLHLSETKQALLLALLVGATFEGALLLGKLCAP